MVALQEEGGLRVAETRVAGPAHTGGAAHGEVLALRGAGGAAFESKQDVVVNLIGGVNSWVH